MVRNCEMAERNVLDCIWCSPEEVCLSFHSFSDGKSEA